MEKLWGYSGRNLKRKQIHGGDACHIDDRSYTTVTQDRCTHQAFNPAEVTLQAFDNHLLLTKKFIDHQSYFSIAGLDDDCKSSIAVHLQ